MITDPRLMHSMQFCSTCDDKWTAQANLQREVKPKGEATGSYKSRPYSLWTSKAHLASIDPTSRFEQIFFNFEYLATVLVSCDFAAANGSCKQYKYKSTEQTVKATGSNRSHIGTTALGQLIPAHMLPSGSPDPRTSCDSWTECQFVIKAQDVAHHGVGFMRHF